MAQGSRKRMALLGAGLIVSMGLVAGCTDNDRKPTQTTNKGIGLKNAVSQPYGGPGTGFSQAGRQSGTTNFGTNAAGNGMMNGSNMGNYNTMNGPTTSGAVGSGQPMTLGGNAPSLTPPGGTDPYPPLGGGSVGNYGGNPVPPSAPGPNGSVYPAAPLSPPVGR